MRIIYKIESVGNPDIEVTPYSGKDLQLVWNKEDDLKQDFKKELKEITLVKSDYKYFYELEKDVNRCNLQTLRVLMDCGFGGDQHQLFAGTFSMSDGQWDLDRCSVKFKIKAIDAYECIEENDDDLNLLATQPSVADPEVLARIIPVQNAVLGLFVNIETYYCNQSLGQCNDTFIEEQKYTFVKQVRGGSALAFSRINFYVRFILIAPFDYIPTQEWKYIEDVEFGKKYATEYLGDDLERVADIFIDGSEIDTIVHFTGVAQLNNGMMLYDAMQYLLNQSCPDANYTIVSDFFQWNPESPSSINYVTGESNLYTKLKLFQKSDAKRMASSSFATKAETNFIELLEDVCKIFNLGYKIESETFRLEHISYFQTDLGINLLATDNANTHLKGTKKYSYDANKLPKFEKFSFMEAGAPDFVGTDIYYDSNCVNNQQENKKEISVSKITTDIMHLVRNPSSQSDVASDDGFVLVAVNNDNRLIYLPGILGDDTSLNNVLSWAYLQEKFYKHGRILPEGYLNNEFTNFESTIPTIKQDKFNALLSCDLIKVFDPLDKVRGTLGYGYVQTAELTLSKCLMSFELLLEDIDNTPFQQSFGDFDGDHSGDFD